jgi:hypothetical protein
MPGRDQGGFNVPNVNDYRNYASRVDLRDRCGQRNPVDSPPATLNFVITGCPGLCYRRRSRARAVMGRARAYAFLSAHYRQGDKISCLASRAVLGLRFRTVPEGVPRGRSTRSAGVRVHFRKDPQAPSIAKLGALGPCVSRNWHCEDPPECANLELKRPYPGGSRFA